MAQPDNFALFQPLVAGALWMTARGLKGSPRSFVLAGLLAGLATLSRTDGILVLGVVLLAFAWDRTRGRGVIPASAAVGAVAAFVLVMAPWWIRQLAVFGMLSPSMASGKVLFIRSIGEWNSIATPATLDHLLGMGAGPLLATRVGGFLAAVTTYIVLIAGLVLAPFIVVGGWARRRSVDFGPFFTYAALLFGFSAIVSAVHVPGGTFIHSAVALAPYSYVLALEGVAVAVAWLGRRRTAWDPGPATRLAIVGTVGVVVVGALASVTRRPRGLGRGSRPPARRSRRAGCGRRAVHGPRHVDRRRRDALLDRPRRRRPRQRPGCHDRRGGRRLRHRLAGPRARRGRPDEPDPRRRPAGVARRADPRGRRPDRARRSIRSTRETAE